jgi:alkylation response protein AidB-like acyl-CoA dehydrogenase
MSSMNFVPTEMQTMLQDMAVRFVRDRYDFETRKGSVRSTEGFSRSVWEQLASLGLLGIEIPEEYGGSGGTFADTAVVLESFGKGLVIEPYLSTVVLGTGLILAAGCEEQKRALLPGVASGLILLALAHTEAGSRYALNHVATRARRDGNAYVIDGHKVVALAADSADRFIVSARTSGADSDTSGISLFMVDPNAEGVEVHAYANLDERRAADIRFDGVKVEASALVGPENDALALLEAVMDRGAAAAACEALGAMSALNVLTLDYIKTRVQFARPIGSFQALQHRMADMMMAEHQARSMLFLAVDGVDSRDPGMRAQAISAAKSCIDLCGQIVGRGAVQLHGGIGMTMEYVVGHLFRRLIALEKMMGDRSYHLQRFALSPGE